MSGLAAAGLAGLLAALALPPYDASPLAWLALTPWLLALRVASPWRGALLGVAFGAVLAAVSALWVKPSLEAGFDVDTLAASVFTAGLLGYGVVGFAAFGALAAALARGPVPRWVAWPAAWLAVEWARSEWGDGLPWLLYGHSQHASLPVLQGAEVAGVLGLGAVLALANTCWAEALAGWWGGEPERGLQARRAAAWGAALVIAVHVGGAWRLASVEADASRAGEPLRVGLVQAAVPQAERWVEAHLARNRERHRALTREAVARGAELVVWSETALDAFQDDPSAAAAALAPALAGADSGAAALVGVPLHDVRAGTDVYTNSALLVAPGGEVAGRYDKIALLPIMERDPALLGAIPFADRVLGPLVRGDPYTAGTSAAPLSLPGRPSASLGVLICFESNLPAAARARVDHGATLLVNLSNDAFLAPAGAAQHFAQAVFRSVETRTPLVRVANRGVSAVVAASGRVTARLDPSRPGVAVADVAPRAGPPAGGTCQDGLALLGVLVVVASLVLRGR